METFDFKAKKKKIEIPPFFNPAKGSGQKSSRMLTTFFRLEAL